MMIHKAKDGSVAITMFAPEIEHSAELKADAIKKFKEMHPDTYTESYEGEYELPADNGNFRNAWTLMDNKIIIHKEKAKAIHMDRIRQARNMELEQLDKAHLRHLGDDAAIAEIASSKQVLRDIPQNYNWDNWDVLSPHWPKELGDKL